jgi:uncharacterized membrane protein YgdD (TMEM256/DUF423 family)
MTGVAMNPDRLFFGIGCVAGGLAVVLGAFGAHALRDRLGPQILAVYETGVRYHVYHAVALVIVGLLRGAAVRSPWLDAAGWLFALGIVLFSGSLYLLSVSGARWLGAITPVGGLAFIGGWALLAIWAWRR